MNFVKKIALIIGLGMAAFECWSSPKSPPGLSLDEAVLTAAGTITAKLIDGGKIAMINFASASEGLSEYVVERKALDLIREELKFQLSGEVSDEFAQSIGQMLGAQYIVTGGLTDVENTYRFRVKVLTVETTALVAASSSDVGKKDERIAFLMNSKSPSKPKVKAPGKYEIGDIGPGGGTVFYVEGKSGFEVSRLLGSYTWDDAIKVAKNY
jgi:hypothetical protein